MPESAAYDPKRQVVYVSNVNHYAKDDNGFISKVSADGKQLDLKWLTGLHSPTGLAVAGDILYAVDYDALVIIDLNRNAILQRISVPDASDIPALNDVAIGVNGAVFVSGSRSRTIYKLDQGNLVVWQQNDQLLQAANGLLIHQDVLLHGGLSWTAFDLTSKLPLPGLTKMGAGLLDIDGITSDGAGGFIVSLIDDARLWHLKVGNLPIPLSEDEISGIDMQYVPAKSMLFLPRVGNTLSAYRITFN